MTSDTKLTREQVEKIKASCTESEHGGWVTIASDDFDALLAHDAALRADVEGLKQENYLLKTGWPDMAVLERKNKDLRAQLEALEEALRRGCGDSCYCQLRKDKTLCWACHGREVLGLTPPAAAQEEP